MEKEGFKRCMENIYEKGGKVMVVATDLDHQFDVWHLSKSITKKLAKKAKKKECADLSRWIRSISNHL
ncbi:unnamed protein product, partial [Pocillopora meandrina]